MTIAPVDFSRRSAPAVARAPQAPSDRWWSPAEDEVVRRRFPGEGAVACLEELPRRSLSAIYGRACKLGVRGGWRKDRPRRQHDPALDEKIRQAWPTLADKGAMQQFAAELGVDRHVITRRAASLGLTRARRLKEPNWSAAEDELLRRAPLHNPRAAVALFADHGFRRSPGAIVVRACRLGLQLRRKDVLTAAAAAEILGVHSQWITKRCIDGSLQAERRGTGRTAAQADTWSIAPDALRAFVIERPEEVDLRKVERFAFIQLLAQQHAPELPR